MINTELIKQIEANVCDCCAWIKEVKPVWREGSIEGSDILDALVLVLDDSVQTALKFSVFKGQLRVQLSQMETKVVATTERKGYADNYDV